MIITLNIQITDTFTSTSWFFADKIEAFVNGHAIFVYEIPAGKKQWKLFNLMNEQPTQTQTRIRTSEAALIYLLNHIYISTTADHEGRYRDGFNPKWLRIPPPELGGPENPHP